MPSPPDLVAHKPHFHRNEAWKQPVRCATGAAGTLASSFEAGDSAGGVTLATGDRILIKDQASQEENGIYRVNASGAPTRDFDMDVSQEFIGALVYVVEGTLAGTIWTCTNTAAVEVGVDHVTFGAFAGGGGTQFSIVAVFDGGTEAITGNPEVDVRVPAAGTLTGWTMLADAAGSAVIDVWKDTLANYPPTDADTMPGAGKEPTLSAAASAEDTNISDWTSVAIAAGDILRFHLDSSATVKRLALTLTYTRS